LSLSAIVIVFIVPQALDCWNSFHARSNHTPRLLSVLVESLSLLLFQNLWFAKFKSSYRSEHNRRGTSRCSKQKSLRRRPGA
jgi:hypothetical protein